MISDLSGLVLNIMISLDFDNDKLLPSLTLVELGNQAFARGEDDGDGIQGYEEIDHTCPDGTEPQRCKWNDAASYDIAGQDPC